MITKIIGGGGTIKTIVSSLRAMYADSALVVECGSKVTGVVKLIFGNSNQRMVIRIKSNMGSTVFTDYLVDKRTLKSFTVDTCNMQVTVELRVGEGKSDTVSIAMYFLACITPFVKLPKERSGAVALQRGLLDQMETGVEPDIEIS